MAMGWPPAGSSMRWIATKLDSKNRLGMRILFVHQDPSPTGGPEAICTLKLIRALVDAGVEIAVVSRLKPHEALRALKVDCHPVDRLGPEGLLEKMSRMANLYPEGGWAWAAAASRKIEELCSKGNISAICSRAMPFISHVAAWRAKKQIAAVPWVAHFSDPWPPDGYSEGRKYSNLRLRWHRRVVKLADVVTFPCERVARFCEERQWGLPSKGPKPQSLILPHIAGDYAGIPKSDFGPAGEMIFMHCGGFTEKRRPDEFLNAWAAFVGCHPEKRQQLKFRHVGGLSQRLTNLAAEKGVADTIEQTGPCSYEESLHRMAEASALVLVDSYKIQTSVYFPSKLSDYIGAGKPVLAMTPLDGTVADLLGKDYPLRADPWNEQMMTEVLDRAFEYLQGNRLYSLGALQALQRECAGPPVAQRLIECVGGLWP
jgi:glycosyltransferase involved in cell wall biosynthesis